MKEELCSTYLKSGGEFDAFISIRFYLLCFFHFPREKKEQM